MSKVASAFLHLTGTNPQEGLGGPPPLPVWRPVHSSRLSGGSTLPSQSKDIHRDSQLPKFMNGNVYFIVLSHTGKWHGRIHFGILK